MWTRKPVKYFLFILSAVFFTISQIQMIGQQNFIEGTIFVFFAVIFFITGLTEFYLNFTGFYSQIVLPFLLKINNAIKMQSEIKKTISAPKLPKKQVFKLREQEPVELKPVIIPGEINIYVPKVIILIMGILFTAISQILLFTHNIKGMIVLIALAVIFFIVYVAIVGEKLEIKIILKKFMQAFFVVLGFIIIII